MGENIIGKVLGSVLGFCLGGPPGALFGFIIGHVHDSRGSGMRSSDTYWSHMAGAGQDFMGQNQQSAFTLGVIVLGAKMAKADGRVTREEVEAFKRAFNVAPAQEAYVGQLFDQARRSSNGFEPYAIHLAGMFRQNRVVLEEILGGLFIIAAADSPILSVAEIDYLRSVAVLFNFSQDDFNLVAARAGVRIPNSNYAPGGASPSEQDESYAILGMKPANSDDEIKAAYRALIREHHPDKLMAQGMPPDFVATATEKMKRINHAYDTISKQRGIR